MNNIAKDFFVSFHRKRLKSKKNEISSTTFCSSWLQ